MLRGQLLPYPLLSMKLKQLLLGDQNEMKENKVFGCSAAALCIYCSNKLESLRIWFHDHVESSSIMLLNFFVCLACRELDYSVGSAQKLHIIILLYSPSNASQTQFNQILHKQPFWYMGPKHESKGWLRANFVKDGSHIYVYTAFFQKMTIFS